jgi:hypothetical protein
MSSKAAQKRYKFHILELDVLKDFVLKAPEALVAAAFQTYRLRLDQILDGRYLEMERRANLLLDADGSNVGRVFEIVDQIRALAGDREGDQAAKFATKLLEPLMRQTKPLGGGTRRRKLRAPHGSAP